MVVAGLLDANGVWRDDLINSLFLSFERDRIYSIRISTQRPSDSWFWVAEKDGIYTVKSAYRRLVGDKSELEVGGASNWVREKWLWNRLWKIPVWPRVKLFFWQLCSEALATRANIAARIRGECLLCSFCNSRLESSLHIFRDCSLARRVWEGLGMEEDDGEDGGGVRDWIEARWREMGPREQARLMVGCWALWEHRNKVVFDDREPDHRSVVRRVVEVMDEMEGGTAGVRKGDVARAEEEGERARWLK
ncbi:uncharacterized protein LOC141648569 [Silene latifolia]|uniref:uncharacterized protein LOC141648569 n=1 Tax=Silene latifolia TaxID=37657 RepID=UPI003D76E5B7